MKRRVFWHPAYPREGLLLGYAINRSVFATDIRVHLPIGSVWVQRGGYDRRDK